MQCKIRRRPTGDKLKGLEVISEWGTLHVFPCHWPVVAAGKGVLLTHRIAVSAVNDPIMDDELGTASFGDEFGAQAFDVSGRVSEAFIGRLYTKADRCHGSTRSGPNALRHVSMFQHFAVWLDKLFTIPAEGFVKPWSRYTFQQLRDTPNVIQSVISPVLLNHGKTVRHFP